MSIELPQTNGVEKHDIEQLWNSLRAFDQKTSTEITELKSSMAGISQAISSLGEQMRDNRPKSIPIVGIFAIVLGIIGTSATYIQARLSPIEKDIKTHDNIFMSQINEIRAQAYNDGQHQAILEVTGKMQVDLKGRMHEVEAETASNKTAISYLRTWIKAVDSEGSRVHVMSVPDTAPKG